MRILFDVRALGEDKYRTRGIGQYIICLLEALQGFDHGHSIRLLTPSNSGGLPESWGCLEQLPLKTPAPLPTSARETARRLWEPLQDSLRSAWREVVLWRRDLQFRRRLRSEGYDVLHFPTHLESPFLLPRRSVVSVMDVIPFLYPEHYAPTRSERRVHRLMLRKAAAITTLSDASKRDIARIHDVPLDRIHVTRLAPHRSFRPVDRAAACERFRHLGPFLLYVGGYDYRKGVPGLIRAFAACRDRARIQHRLVLAGHPPPEGFAETKALRNALAEVPPGSVVTLGYVPFADLPALYSAADALIFPSLYEGFGLPVVEAMACGTPVVALRTSSIPETAGDAALLVPPGDDRALQEAIEAISRNADLRATASAAGLRQAARFTWESCARRTLEVYERVAASTIAREQAGGGKSFFRGEPRS